MKTSARKIFGGIGGAGLAWLFGLMALGAAREPQALLVKRVSGDVRLLGASNTGGPGEAREAHEVKAGDLPDSGATFVTGANGALELRFHPDFMTLSAPAGARLQVGYSLGDSADARTVSLASGRVVGDLSRQGPGLRLEDARSTARMREGRIAFSTDAKASTVLVLEGEAEVTHRATGVSRKVARGQKAVSGPDGTTVTRAEARELADAGLGQNRLEVDFWDPVTEDYKTLEVEYERRP